MNEQQQKEYDGVFSDRNDTTLVFSAMVKRLGGEVRFDVAELNEMAGLVLHETGEGGENGFVAFRLIAPDQVEKH